MKKLVLAGFVAAALSGATGAQAMTLGGWFQGKPAQTTPVVKVQASNAEMQLQQLEETVRTLTGRVEDLNYQLLQMQEQMRKTQEDNEFRFEQLEKKQGVKKSELEIPADKKSQEAADAAASGQPAAQPGDNAQTAAVSGGQPVSSTDNAANGNQPTGQTPGAGPVSEEIAHLQPGTLGSLIFNGDGQLVDTTRNPADNSAQSLPGVSTGVEAPGAQPQGPAADAKPQDQASIPPKTDNVLSSDETYDNAYKLILSGDYVAAEKGFQGYLDQFPKGEKAADASFWLGEAEYSQGRYNDAAKTFLNAYKNYEKAPKAPEILLKLGMSLAALDNKDTACATYKEIPKRYPTAARSVLAKVASERSRLGCSS